MRSLFFDFHKMRVMDATQQLEPVIGPLLGGMGLLIVEVSVERHRGNIKINLVLHKKDGVSLKDLTAAQKILRPRLELEYGRENLSLEISSPGLSRMIRSSREYRIFKGRQFRLLLEGNWIEGRLVEAEEKHILFEIENETIKIPIDGIRKAKLV